MIYPNGHDFYFQPTNQTKLRVIARWVYALYGGTHSNERYRIPTPPPPGIFRRMDQEGALRILGNANESTGSHTIHWPFRGSLGKQTKRGALIIVTTPNEMYRITYVLLTPSRDL